MAYPYCVLWYGPSNLAKERSGGVYVRTCFCTRNDSVDDVNELRAFGGSASTAGPASSANGSACLRFWRSRITSGLASFWRRRMYRPA
jgi:hypothetical protein